MNIKSPRSVLLGIALLVVAIFMTLGIFEKNNAVPENKTVVEVVATQASEIIPTASETAPIPKEPKFEAVFAIAGLLAVAYLVLRQRK